MLALVGAAAFALALILVWAEESIGDVFTVQTLTLIGFICLALHMAGVGAATNWRSYRRSGRR
jgi:hypothetical protein